MFLSIFTLHVMGAPEDTVILPAMLGKLQKNQVELVFVKPVYIGWSFSTS